MRYESEHAQGAHLDYQVVRTYLEARGWQRLPSRLDTVGVYRRPEDSNHEVVFPLDRTFADYGESMARAAKRIAEFEARPASEVLVDLARPRWDTLRFALTGEATGDGSVGLIEGIELFHGARKALLASACGVEQPKRFYPRMSLAKPEAFLRECRLGQTEIGSFVVTVACKLDLPLEKPSEPQPFGRRVSTFLLRSTDHLVRSLRSGRKEKLLTPADDEPWVSANLCEALTEMMPANEAADLRLQASWAPLLPTPPSTAAVVTVDRNLFEAVEDLGRLLRPRQGDRHDLFVGKVAELAGAPNEEGRMEGLAVLLLQVEDELLKTRVTLTPDAYRTAFEAHFDQEFVSARGILRRGARISLLESVTDFAKVTA